MIRQATLADLEVVCALVFRASQFVFATALQSDAQHEHEALFAQFYQQSQTKFSLENTLVYEQDGQVVGCIVSYPASQERDYITTMTQILPNGYQFPAETQSGTHYIDSLAVTPAAEGQGIARKLIEAVAESTELPLALLVEKEKVHVKAYYERLGFEAGPIEIFFATEMYPMVRPK